MLLTGLEKKSLPSKTWALEVTWQEGKYLLLICMY